jgi:hypothetical protein
MMVALWFYAYARGIRSSRVIERACEENVAVDADLGLAFRPRASTTAGSAGPRRIRRAPAWLQHLYVARLRSSGASVAHP